MKTDIEIAQEAKMKPITQIAAQLGLEEESVIPYGRYKAKIDHRLIHNAKKQGKLILVTAISPTPAGEGKTTTSVGLADAMNALGKKTMLCLREPSLGPVFGVKGGAAGGGYAQVVPMEDINLHFTGDLHAIGTANNLLAAMIDNSIQQGNPLNIDPRRIIVAGFSAGGHLALSGAVLAVPGLPDPTRPNAVILGYPVITAGEYAHRGSFVQLAGEDPAAQQAFSLEDKITPRTPPVFVWHTMEDETVPVENTLLLVSALHRAGVPCEAHLFEKGCHGTSLSTAEVNHPSAHRSRWLTLAREWLDDTFDFHLGTGETDG